MPELPEVETVVRDLRPQLVGRQIVGIRVGPRLLRRPWKQNWNELVLGEQIVAVERRGKWILIPLRSGQELVVHLGMTGQFTVVSDSEPEPDHLHLVFALDHDCQLRFRDVRRFGSMELFPTHTDVESYLADKLGPEPFDLDPDQFRNDLISTTRQLKAVLLDQTVVAGVGNIYADEALHRAGLHPQRRGNTVTALEANRLREAIQSVLLHAIEERGSTIRDYIGGSGLRGNYQREFQVYGQTGEPCPTCQTAIEMKRVAGRSSHFCPRCQPESAKKSRSLPRH